MRDSDRIKFERLIKTVRRNFQITYWYKEYLERFPTFITKEIIDTLTEDGEISVESAIAAMLGQAFRLEFDNDDDRRFIMDYITPSIRLLDRKKYEDNPYYKNIRLDNIKNGSWEIRWEEYEPYQAVICDDIIIKEDFSEIPPLGYFPEGFRFPAILEGGNEWMTLTPVDLDTCEDAIAAAHGKVLTFGLGLGYYAYMASEKEEVESVTVVELSEEVIELFNTYILPQMPNRHKIKIVHMDAIEYAKNIMPSENFDLVFADTWRDASDGAPMYERLKPFEKLCPSTKFMYWVENFLRSNIRSLKFGQMIADYEDGELEVDYEAFVESIRKI